MEASPGSPALAVHQEVERPGFTTGAWDRRQTCSSIRILRNPPSWGWTRDRRFGRGGPIHSTLASEVHTGHFGIGQLDRPVTRPGAGTSLAGFNPVEIVRGPAG